LFNGYCKTGQHWKLQTFESKILKKSESLEFLVTVHSYFLLVTYFWRSRWSFFRAWWMGHSIDFRLGGMIAKQLTKVLYIKRDRDRLCFKLNNNLNNHRSNWLTPRILKFTIFTTTLVGCISNIILQKLLRGYVEQLTKISL